MKVNGIELNFNHADYADLERYLAAKEKCDHAYKEAKREEEKPGIEHKIAGLRLYIDGTRAFFNDLFGEKTADSLFGDSTDGMTYIRAVSDFGAELQAQVDADNKETAETIKRQTEKLARFQPQK